MFSTITWYGSLAINWRSTNHKDTEFTSAFLMTLNTFSTPMELIKLLEIRFNIPKPKNPSKQQLEQFMKSRMIPLHMKIYNVVKTWVNGYIEDFVGNQELIERMNQLLDKWHESNKQLTKTSQTIRNTFVTKVCLFEWYFRRTESLILA